MSGSSTPNIISSSKDTGAAKDLSRPLLQSSTDTTHDNVVNENNNDAFQPSSTASASANGSSASAINTTSSSGSKGNIKANAVTDSSKATSNNNDEKENANKIEEDEIGLPNRGFFDIYKYADKYDFMMLFVGVLSAVANGTVQPMQSIIVGRIFGGQAGLNSAVLHDQIDNNIKYLMALGISALVLSYMQYLCFMISAERIIYRLKSDCFKSLIRQENAYFDRRKSGVLAARITEQGFLIQSGIAESFGTALQYTSQFITGFIVAFSKNWRVAGVMLCCMPAISTLLPFLIFSIVFFVKKATRAYEEAGGVAEETLSSIQTVASFSGEAKSCNKYDERLKAAESAGIKLVLVRGCGMGLMFSTIFLTFGIGYLYGATRIAAGGVDFGSVLTTVMSCIMGSVAIGVATPQISAISQAKAGANSLFRIIDRKPAIDIDAPGISNPPYPTTNDGKLAGDIKFEGVVFRYPTRQETFALNQCNFEVKSGETCALVGTSGCGKSTCIALLERFYDVEAGSVKIDGIDVRQYNLRWLRQQIALVGQEPLLFDISIADNIRYGKRDATMDEIIASCKSSNAHDFIMEFPDGYATKVGGAGSKLSGGQKQRICIARALIKNPSILLLDEATSALDNVSEKVVQKAIDELLATQRRTTIIIAHRYTTIQNCNKIVVLNNDGHGGKVVEIGTHDELITREGSVYKHLVEAQQKQHSAGITHPPKSSPMAVPSITTQSSPQRLSASGSPNSSRFNIPSVDSETQAILTRSDSIRQTIDGISRVSDLLGPSTASFQEENPLRDGIPDLQTQGRQTSTSSVIPREEAVSYSSLHTDDLERNASFVSGTDITDPDTIAPPKTIDGLDPSKFDRDGVYIVDQRRVWEMTWKERYYFALGFIGAALKGSSQPLLSLVISHIMSHMILIPNKIDGINFTEKCHSSSDCHDSKYPYCLDLTRLLPSHDGPLLGAFCTAVCSVSSDCSSEGSTCINMKSMGIDHGLCVPEGAWLDGHSPDDVRHTGLEAFMLYSLVGLGAGVGVAVQASSFGYIGEKLTRRLRLLTFSSLVRQDSSFFDDEKNSVGTLLTRLATDASLVKSGTGEYTGVLVESSVTLIVALTIAFVSSWRMASVVIFGIPLMAFSMYFQHRNLTGLNRTGIESQQDSGKVVGEATSGVRTVQSFAADDLLSDMYSSALVIPMRSGFKNAHYCGLGTGFAQFLFFSVYSFGIWYGGELIGKGQIDAKHMNRVFLALTFSATSIGQSQARANDSSKAKIATSNIFRLADRVSPIDPNSTKGRRIQGLKGNIEFRNVDFHYPTRSSVPILNKISFKIQAGQTVAFVGSSGCGKSSIIRLIERFYDPDNFSSQILIDGVDLRELNISWWRSKIALVGQEPRLFEGTIAENVGYGKKNATMDEIIEACKAANAHDFIMEFPNQYQTNCGSKGSQLSGGQKQRIAIARALIRKPTILLLDEATSALDNESERVVQAALDRLMQDKGRTTITIAHRLSTIINCDLIIVIHNENGQGGVVVESGNHEELMKLEGYYAKLQSVGKLM